jgi:hypothetical protein
LLHLACCILRSSSGLQIMQLVLTALVHLSPGGASACQVGRRWCGYVHVPGETLTVCLHSQHSRAMKLPLAYLLYHRS